MTIELSRHAGGAVPAALSARRLEPLGAEEELARLTLVAEVTPEPPEWHLISCAQVAALYLVAGDVVLPLRRHVTEPDVLVATTCLARGTTSDDVRRRRRAVGRGVAGAAASI